MMIKAFKGNPSRLTVYFCLLFLLLTGAVHFLVSYFQLNSQKQFSQSLLTKAEEVSWDISNSIEQALDANLQSCHQVSINKLRKILANYEYTQDIGIIENGVVKCSANWGVLEAQTHINEHFYKSTETGFFFAKEVEGVFPIHAKYDAAMKNGIIAFTVPKPFKHYDNLNKEFSFQIISNDKQHTFHKYLSDMQFQHSFILKPQKVVTCSKKFEYCITTSNNRPGLFYFPAYISFLFVSSLGFISFLIAYSFISYSDKTQLIEYRLREALKNDELYVEYQPILAINSKQIIGVESLIRWKDKIHGQVSPELFLSIAEQLSIYPTLAYTIVLKTFKELSPILSSNQIFSVAINVNSYEIQSDEYLSFLLESCEKYNFRPNQVKIEITERIELPLCELATFALKARKLGFKIALDDFGTGVSNLVWLTEINFDIIKVDRVFTQTIDDELKKDMITAIMSLIKNLNRTIIFEGVETAEQSTFIESYNNNYQIQGWYFYKSLPIKELEVIVSRELKKR